MRTLSTWTPRILALAALVALGAVGASALREHPADTTLVGMQLPPDKAPLSARTLWSGEYQKAAEARAAAAIPSRPKIVRAYNQWQWDTFGTSSMASGSIIRGRKGALFEESYIEAHCGLRLKVDVAAMPDYARRLRRVQDWFEARGQKFVYVLAPIKPTWFPDKVPPGYPCEPGKRDSVYPAAREALTRAGIHWVDGRAALEAQRGKLGYEFFPRNGIHWNQLGVALGAGAFTAELNRQGVSTPALTWDLAEAPDEAGLDRDLSGLLNLRRQPKGWKAPAVTAHRVGPSKLTVTAVNDSFFDPLALLLSQAGLVARARNYGYLTLAPVEYRDGGAYALTATPEIVLKDLMASDVVVLEQVESQTGGAVGRKFLDLVEGQIARESASKRGALQQS
jgi:hypothetical protein